MGKTNSALGKAVKNSLGYTVRMMVTGKTDEKTKKTFKIHNGKFGIYAGKNKIDEANDVHEAVSKINVLVAQNIIDNKKLSSGKK